MALIFFRHLVRHFMGRYFFLFFICLAPSGFLLPVPSGYLVVNGANPLLVACASLDALRHVSFFFFRNGEKINTGFLYWQSKTTISAASPQVHYWRPVVFGFFFFFLLSKSATTRRKKFNQLKWFFGLAIHYRRIYRMQSRWLSNTVVVVFSISSWDIRSWSIDNILRVVSAGYSDTPFNVGTTWLG